MRARERPPAAGGTEDRPTTFGGAARQALERSGGVTGVVVAAVPAVAFVIANSVGGLTTALVALAVAAVAAFGVRLARREPLASTSVGLVVAGVGALVAATTGEARAFFLVPTLLPAAILLACLASIVVRRPLTGLLLNRLAGGPADWRGDRGLVRVYTVTTLVAVAINLVNVAVQAVFYVADRPAVLAVAHVATGPVFALLVAGTLVAARRRTAGAAPSGRLRSGPARRDG